MKNAKVIVRLKGGLGNQLFCYAAARRLALVNNAELVIDDVTGFVRDRRYQRKYVLDKFSITARKATPRERMEPFERYRRGFAKFIARQQPFHERKYIEQERTDFDPRLLDLRLKNTIYIDGLWQSERYFKDVEVTIRRDLRIFPPQDAANQEMARRIQESNSVGVHVRWYSKPGTDSGNNLEHGYYSEALKYIIDNVSAPHFFLFSDDPDSSRKIFALPKEMVTCISHNKGAENAYADLWLMGQCKHFIIANSTFSWWGAWLSEAEPKIVLAPGMNQSIVASWRFRSLIPDNWILIPLDC